jgi:hypothetical protein
MSQALEIMQSSANEAMKRAIRCAKYVEQDWNHCSTTYTFEDQSTLVVCGPQVNAYASLEEALQALRDLEEKVN